LQTLPNRGIGYGLIRYLGEKTAKDKLQQLPQAEIFFCYQGQQRESANRKTQASFVRQPLEMGPRQSQQGLRRHLIEINAVIQKGQLNMHWVFSANLHERVSIERLTREFVAALQAILTDRAENLPELESVI
jgi:non-ribosomal peptide synthase protein (TIGR01720 family)